MGSNLFDLTGRIALVTGSSRGIGKELAAGQANAGATIVLHGRNTETLAATTAEFEQRVGSELIFSYAFDVTDAAAVAENIAKIEAEVGPIRILVNNAGIQHRVPLLELEVTDWQRVLDTNLTSAFLVGREAARGMLERGAGKIINICSVQTDLARPAIAAYTAAKGGPRNLTRAMTAQWAGSGLQINGIAPGSIHTETTQNLVDDEKFNSWILGRTPAGRWGTVADLAGPAVWLASDGSDNVNGHTIFIDGGMTVVV
jgi:gluconate 5-dehydrogenase